MIRSVRGRDLDWWRTRHGPLTPRIREFVRRPPREKRDSAPGLPRISIVTPSFNQGRFIEETILSVLNQGYPNLEYFVVDGGSTDDSVAIIRKYERHLAGWVSERDAGQADAIAKGFARSTGRILAWINSDDLLLPNALPGVGRAFARWPSTQFVYGHALRCDESTAVTDILFTYPNCYWPKVNRADNVFQGSVFWSREAYDRSGGLDTHLAFAMEYPLIHYLMGHETGVFLNAPLAAFREQPAQKTRTMGARAHDELEALYGDLRLPWRWHLGMSTMRMLNLVTYGNLFQKLRIRVDA